MAVKQTHFRTLAGCLIAATAASVLASCAPVNRAPETVSVKNPGVTYKYRGDQELLRANQQAVAFCNQYGTAPQTLSLTSDQDGTSTVVFECVKVGTPAQVVAPVTPLPPVNPALSYNYRTERELLDASRRADSYCMQYGQRMVSTTSIVTNADGSRTASFQCGSTVAAPWGGFVQ